MDSIEKGKKNVAGRSVTNDDIFEIIRAALNKEKGGIIKTFLN